MYIFCLVNFQSFLLQHIYVFTCARKSKVTCVAWLVIKSFDSSVESANVVTNLHAKMPPDIRSLKMYMKVIKIFLLTQ